MRKAIKNHLYFARLLLALLAMVRVSAAIAQDIHEDIQSRQIAIEAMVVEINEEYTRNLGLSYTLNRNEQNAPGNNLKAVDVRFPFNPDLVKVPTFSDATGDLGYIVGFEQQLPGLGFNLSGMDVGMGQFSASLRALLLSGNAEVRAHTIAVAMNGTPVTIETVDEVPFQDVRYDKGQQRLDVSFEKVGVRLRSSPTILDLQKGRIQLDIEELDLSSVTGYVTLQNVNRPIFAKSSANTTVEMTSGETFILGGFKIRREVVKESGVPFLRRIPVLGYLFKSEKKVQENKDVLFFITPYLLEPSASPILPYDFEHGRFLQIRNTPVNFE